MKLVCVLLFSASIALAAEQPSITRESLEKMFQSVRAEPGQLVIQIKNIGPRFSRRRGEEEATVNNYGETIRIKLGERVRFSTHHMSLEFRPLPAPLDKDGFLIQSHFDARSFGGGESTSYGIVLLLGDAANAELKFIEPEQGFNPRKAKIDSDPTYQKIIKIAGESDLLARHELVGEGVAGEVKPPLTSAITGLHLRWQKKPQLSQDPLGIRWIAEDAAGTEKNHLIATGKSEPDKNEGEFTLKKPTAGFPPGQYRIEIWQSVKMIYSEKFEIKAQ